MRLKEEKRGRGRKFFRLPPPSLHRPLFLRHLLNRKLVPITRDEHKENAGTAGYLTFFWPLLGIHQKPSLDDPETACGTKTTCRKKTFINGYTVIFCRERGLIFLFDKGVSRYTFSTFPVGKGGG